MPEADDRKLSIQWRGFAATLRMAVLPTGVRLPPERHLTDELGMTRSTLRKALDALERDGVIWRHVGKGTFIADGSPQAPDQRDGRTRASAYSVSHDARPHGDRACNRAGSGRQCFRRHTDCGCSGRLIAPRRRRPGGNMKSRTTSFIGPWPKPATILLLLSLFDQLNGVRRAVAWGNVTRRSALPSPDHSSFAEHDAIANGDRKP